MLQKQLETVAVREYAGSKMQFDNFTALAAILTTTLTASICFEVKNLRLCLSAEAGICS